MYSSIYHEPGSAVEAGAVTPGLVGAVPGGGVVPVNGGAGVLTVQRTTQRVLQTAVSCEIGMLQDDDRSTRCTN